MSHIKIKKPTPTEPQAMNLQEQEEELLNQLINKEISEATYNKAIDTIRTKKLRLDCLKA